MTAVEFPPPSATITFLSWYRRAGNGRRGVTVFQAYAKETGAPMKNIKSAVEAEGYTIPQLILLDSEELPEPRTIPPKRRPKKESKLPKGPTPEEIEEKTKAYQPLVRKIATRYTHLLEFDDAVSVGNIGLLEAIRTFNESAGVKFGTVAYRRIQGRIIDEIRIIYGRRRQRYLMTESLDSMTEEHRDAVIKPADEEQPEDLDWPESVAPYLADLSESESQLLYRLFVLDEQLSQIAKDMGIPVYHLVRMKRDALAKVKSKFLSDPAGAA